jgi:uncharacterized protein (TIGR02231 family)
MNFLTLLHLSVEFKNLNAMKKFALTLFVLLISITFVNAGDDDKTPVKSEIKSVTVFVNGAQVNRTASTTVPAGTSYLVFEGLSQYVNANSVQVKGTGEFVILSVTSQMNYLNLKDKTKEVLAIEDSLVALNSRLTYQQALLENYVTEKNMIIANQSIGGSQTGVKIEDLKAAAEFFRTRLADISTKYIAANALIKKIQESITQYTNQLSTENAKYSTPTSEIVVAVTAKTKVTAAFEINYAVTGASWYPSYDLRATDTSSPISLDYRANVYQSTGEDWENVTLTLSTGNPSVSNTKPIIYPWYLYIYNNYSNYRTDKAGYVSQELKSKDEELSSTNGNNTLVNAETAANYTTIDVNATNFEFEISLPYTIKSGGKSAAVQIQEYSLPATYEYYAAPKQDLTAYLLAKVTGWEDYNLLSGYANLYFEGTYVGKSYIDVKSTKDTLDFSLGRDENIVITRTKQKDYSTHQFIGNNRKESFAWEISVRNKKKTAINITIQDQLPLTTDKDIEIEKGETSNATYDETQGFLTWKFSIKSAETKKMNFSYSVKYPKDKNVYIE